MLSRWLTSPTFRVLARLLLVALVAPAPLWAQAPPGGQGPPAFKPEELDQVAAPIALYPDPLVAQILMASTYPLELVEAARFAKANPNLTGTPLDEALKQQTWDDSVKALVAFPQVVTMMSDKLDWTQKLGDAFLGQQKELMDAVQRLRAKAQAQGNLKDSSQQKIVVEQAPPPAAAQAAAPPPTTIIKIEPANPQVIYVPTYNPTVVYGAWPYPAYPPYAYYPPGYAMATAATAAFTFAAGVAVGSALWGNCNWGHGDVNVNVNQYNNFTKNVNTANIASQRTQIQNTRVANNNGAWQHDPAHRQGVQYRDNATQQRFNKTGAPNPQSREAFRGRAEQGRQEIARGNVQGLDAARGRAGGSGAGQQRAGGGVQGGGMGQGGASLGQNRGGAQQLGGGSSGQNRQGGSTMGQNRSGGSGFGETRGASAFQGVGDGRDVSAASNRGAQSRQSLGASGGATRAGGSSGGGGAARGGGGAARGGARGR
jgi:hypothetical protein